MKIDFTVYVCNRCGHVWMAKRLRQALPKKCGNKKCASPYWDKPRDPVHMPKG